MQAVRVLKPIRSFVQSEGPPPAYFGDLALDEVAQASVFFGHQSVGRDILTGVRELSYPRSLAWEDAAIGENTKPLSKIAAFVERVTARALKPQIAFFKFCYVDFDQQVDERLVFEAYADALKSLRRHAPETTFIHVTAPLTVRTQGLREWLTRQNRAALENRKRHAYNELLRAEYAASEPVFDLAALESGAFAGGTANIESCDAPALTPTLTDDGGHLNRIGRIVVAEHLLRLLSAVLRERAR